MRQARGDDAASVSASVSRRRDASSRSPDTSRMRTTALPETGRPTISRWRPRWLKAGRQKASPRLSSRATASSAVAAPRAPARRRSSRTRRGAGRVGDDAEIALDRRLGVRPVPGDDDLRLAADDQAPRGPSRAAATRKLRLHLARRAARRPDARPDAKRRRRDGDEQDRAAGRQGGLRSRSGRPEAAWARSRPRSASSARAPDAISKRQRRRGDCRRSAAPSRPPRRSGE